VADDDPARNSFSEEVGAVEGAVEIPMGEFSSFGMVPSSFIRINIKM
jgi:hypothetical protein